jgi:hypothetical protein
MAIPRRMLAAISVVDLLSYLVTGDKFVSVSLSLTIIEKYLAEAGHLQRRLTRARRAGAGAMTDTTTRGGRRGRPFPFAAIHFYANCWTIIRSHLGIIRDVTGLLAVGRALRPHNKVFSAYNDIRNHYEHFADRLPGQKRQARLRDRADLGNLVWPTLTIGGDRFDVGPTSLKKLRSIVADVLGAFKHTALERLAVERPADFARVVRRAQTNLLVRRVTKDLRL